MTYNANEPNNLRDPNYPNVSNPALATRNPRGRANDRSYGGWIIGAFCAAAVILGIMFLLPMSNNNIASNNNGNTSSQVRQATPPASTTGSGATSPAPANSTAPPTNR